MLNPETNGKIAKAMPGPQESAFTSVQQDGSVAERCNPQEPTEDVLAQDRGVSLSYLMCLVGELLDDDSTCSVKDAVQRFILTRTAQDKCSYHDLVPPQQRGPPRSFLAIAWDAKLADVAACLRNHFVQPVVPPSLRARRPSVPQMSRLLLGGESSPTPQLCTSASAPEPMTDAGTAPRPSAPGSPVPESTDAEQCVWVDFICLNLHKLKEQVITPPRPAPGPKPSQHQVTPEPSSQIPSHITPTNHHNHLEVSPTARSMLAANGVRTPSLSSPLVPPQRTASMGSSHRAPSFSISRHVSIMLPSLEAPLGHTLDFAELDEGMRPCVHAAAVWRALAATEDTLLVLDAEVAVLQDAWCLYAVGQTIQVRGSTSLQLVLGPEAPDISHLAHVLDTLNMEHAQVWLEEEKGEVVREVGARFMGVPAFNTLVSSAMGDCARWEARCIERAVALIRRREEDRLRHGIRSEGGISGGGISRSGSLKGGGSRSEAGAAAVGSRAESGAGGAGLGRQESAAAAGGEAAGSTSVAGPLSPKCQSVHEEARTAAVGAAPGAAAGESVPQSGSTSGTGIMVSALSDPGVLERNPAMASSPRPTTAGAGPPRPGEGQAGEEGSVQRGGPAGRCLRAATQLQVCGDLLKLSGDLEDGERLHRAALELRVDCLGESHPLTLISMSRVAECASAQGRHTEAAPLREHVWGALVKQRGEHDVSALRMLVAAATARSKAGDHAGAAQMFSRALKGLRDVEGPSHPATLACMTSLADCYASRGSPTEQLDVLREILSLRHATEGEKSDAAVAVLRSQAACLQVLGRHEEAEKSFQQVVDLLAELHGDKHPQTMLALQSLAGCLYAQGQVSEALPWFERLAAAREAAAGDPLHPDAVDARDLVKALRVDLARRSSTSPIPHGTQSAKSCTAVPQAAGGTGPGTQQVQVLAAGTESAGGMWGVHGGAERPPSARVPAPVPVPPAPPPAAAAAAAGSVLGGQAQQPSGPHTVLAAA